MDYRFGRRRRNNPLVSGCLSLVIGIVFMLAGFFLLRDTIRFLPGTLTASGVITHCEYGTGDDANSCTPTVNFKTNSGQSINFVASESSTSFHQNDEVSVKYHASTPHDGRIYSFMDTWFLPGLIGVIGLLVFLISPFVLLRGVIRRLLGLPY